jgi:hypothetical protein
MIFFSRVASWQKAAGMDWDIKQTEVLFNAAHDNGSTRSAQRLGALPSSWNVGVGTDVGRRQSCAATNLRVDT